MRIYAIVCNKKVRRTKLEKSLKWVQFPIKKVHLLVVSFRGQIFTYDRPPDLPAIPKA